MLMKKFITLAIALCAGAAAFAQADPSTWEEGQNVAAALGMGDVDGSFGGPTSENSNGDLQWDSMGDYWKGSKPTEYAWNEETGVGAIGIYFDGKSTGDLTDMYQVVYFPAGYYTVKAQALYREGTPGDNFNNMFNGVVKKNAWIYADLLSSEDANSAVTRTFETNVRSLATSGQTERLFFDSDGSWKNDASGTGLVNGEEVTYWCPCCLNGARTYFENDLYQNSFNVVIKEACWVRIGFRKTGNIAQDWLVWNNLQVIYNGPADEKAELDLALNDMEAGMNKDNEIADQIEGYGFSALASIVYDGVMEIEGNTDMESLESVLAAVKALDALYETAVNSRVIASSLAELIEMSEDMAASTDFEGKADFTAAFEAIKEKAYVEDPEEIGYDPKAYAELFKQLQTARATYLNTSPVDENGAKDFSSLIKFPWFVNPEYTPVQIDNTCDGRNQPIWCIQQGGDTSMWHYNAVAAGPSDFPGSIAGKGGRENVSSKVVLGADEDVQNQWYKYLNYTAGWSGGLKLMYQGSLVGVSDGWNSGLTGTQEIRQQLAGLPNGYYSVKALMRGNVANGEWDREYHNIFARNSEGVEVKSAVGTPDSEYSPTWGWNEWNGGVWQEHKTGIVSVPDGQLLIGGQTSMVMNVTGFRLMFYGETPSFDAMIQEELADINAKMEGMQNIFAGDKKYVEEQLATIVLPIASAAAYEEAFAKTTEIKQFLASLSTAMNGYNLPTKYDDLYNACEAGSAKASILEPALEFINALGTADDDTSEKIAPAKEVYNAYDAYLKQYDKAEAYASDAINAKLAEQAAALAKGYSDVETLNAYAAELGLLINAAIIEQAGGKDATRENPANITALLNNPDLSEGPKTGWDCTVDPSCNTYGRQLAEIWNQASWTVSQTIVGLPEGTYAFKVRACYRDGGDINNNGCYTSWKEANGDKSAWANHNAEIFAKTSDDAESMDYITSVCDGQWTDLSFTEWFNMKDAAEEYKNLGYSADWDNTICIYNFEELLPEDQEEADAYRQTANPDAPAYPFDTRVVDGDNVYYYPCSMGGFQYRIAKDPEAYNNVVYIYVPEGGTLTVGLRKAQGPSGDWVIYDDFQLEYLGGDKDPVGINSINNVKAAQKDIFNLAGQKLAAPQKGLNIIDGKKVFIK